MRFNHYSVQKASNIQRFAANLDAIDYITVFRRKHRKLFKVIISIMIAGAVLFVLLVLASFLKASITTKATSTAASADQIHAYEIIADNQAVIYFTVNESRNLWNYDLQITLLP